ncbi:hypothetical protein NBRC116594_02110 [Shimia sp. NS0008-38b]|uniref:response regulator n=1 Tax=Shimia sp. NS0008-38b TaxID=3127653 RepID=UPI0031022BB2
MTTQKIADLARQTETEIAAMRSYTDDILAMTHMVEKKDVQEVFNTQLGRLRHNLDALGAIQFDAQLSFEISKLASEVKEWTDRSAILLSLKQGVQIPAFWTLHMHAQNAKDQAEVLVKLSEEKANHITTASQRSLQRTVLIVATLSVAVFVVMTGLATIVANQISHSMNDISSSLAALADMEGVDLKANAGEISKMFAALNVVRNSIYEKSNIAQQLVFENRRAEAALQTKARFLANMSHEIRTPINGILGMAEVLDNTDLDDDQKECSETILSASEALLLVINSILDFSKNESGETKLVREPFNLCRLIYDIATLLSPSGSGKNVEICIDYPVDVPHLFVGDAQRCRQILMNLIGNAVKFTPEGFISIIVRLDSSAHKPLSISIQDNGIGIPEDRLDDIFVAFQQVDMKSTRRFDGTGLGLAITKQLIDLMSGEIGVTSTPGGGTTFRVALNLPVADKNEDTLTSNDIDLRMLQNKHVLVVDDLAINRTVLRRRLQHWGISVDEFESADSLLEKIEENPGFLTIFDAAIFDYHMPRTDGVELLQAILHRDGTDLCPVVLYSSSDKLSEVDALRSAGFSAVLMKPARAEAMARVLWNVMAASQPVAEHKPIQSAEIALKNARVLIAEDNRTNQLVVRKLLAKTGAKLSMCDNGQVALDAYKADGADVILMDMSMPVMDGLTATNKIREFEQETGKPSCPIIALTANAMEEDRQACHIVGMDDFLAKPVRKAELIKALIGQLAEKDDRARKRHNTR